MKIYPDVEISTESGTILNRCGLRFHTSGVKLYWANDNGRLKGEIEWTPELERQIQNVAPKNIFEVISLLS